MEKVLVALDGSPRERSVLVEAVALAQKTSARLVLFHAVGLPVALPREALAMSPSDVQGLLEERALKHLVELEGTVPEAVRAGRALGIGTAWRAICDAARDHKVDLIVIGSHGFGGIDRLLGTTAAKVVNHADRSVLVVRARD